MPTIANNPKFLLWRKRAEQEGTTSANRGGTDDFIAEELPSAMKMDAKNLVDGYRTVVDFPSKALNFGLTLGIIYIIYTFNQSK